MIMSTPEVKKTITAVDKSAKGILSAIAGLSKVSTELTALVNTSADLSFEIEAKSSELSAIKETIAADLRTAKAELNIQVLENEDKVLDKLMKARSFATITNEDLIELQGALDQAQSDNAEAIAVSKAETGAAIAANAKASKQEAEHAVATASLEADNKALTAKIEFLSESNSSLQKMLDAACYHVAKRKPANYQRWSN